MQQADGAGSVEGSGGVCSKVRLRGGGGGGGGGEGWGGLGCEMVCSMVSRRWGMRVDIFNKLTGRGGRRGLVVSAASCGRPCSSNRLKGCLQSADGSGECLQQVESGCPLQAEGGGTSASSGVGWGRPRQTAEERMGVSAASKKRCFCSKMSGDVQ